MYFIPYVLSWLKYHKTHLSHHCFQWCFRWPRGPKFFIGKMKTHGSSRLVSCHNSSAIRGPSQLFWNMHWPKTYIQNDAMYYSFIQQMLAGHCLPRTVLVSMDWTQTLVLYYNIIPLIDASFLKIKQNEIQSQPLWSLGCSTISSNLMFYHLA